MTTYEVLVTLLSNLSTTDLNEMLAHTSTLNRSLSEIARNRNFSPKTSEENTIECLLLTARIGVAINAVKGTRIIPGL